MITIDTREPYIKATKLFADIAPSMEVNVQKLDLGDYLLSPNDGSKLLIERKTVNDYTSHLSDLKDKLYRMRSQYSLSGLLLEGSYKTTSSMIVERRGSGRYETVSLASFHNFLFHQEIQGSLLFRTNDLRESVLLISNLHNYFGKLSRCPVPPMTDPEPMDLLTFLPGIKEERALQLIEHYGSVGNALRKVKEWSNVPGIGSKTVSKINKFLYKVSQGKNDREVVEKDKKREFENDWVRLSNQKFQRKYYRGPWSDL